jgi:hypothetical protein
MLTASGFATSQAQELASGQLYGEFNVRLSNTSEVRGSRAKMLYRVGRHLVGHYWYPSILINIYINIRYDARSESMTNVSS